MRQGATYRAAMALMGWSIVMTDTGGNAAVIECGIKTLTRANRRVEYWTKAEAKANKRVTTPRDSQESVETTQEVNTEKVRA